MTSSGHAVKKTWTKRKHDRPPPPPPIVAEINELAKSWKSRLSPWKKRRKGPFTVGSDCAGYGSELLALRLLGLQGKCKLRMVCEQSDSKLALHQKMVEMCGVDDRACQVFRDMFQRQSAAAPSVDLYCAGYPCPAFSRIGRRRGTDEERGRVTLSGLHHIASARPRCILLEQVDSILDRNHQHVWNFVLKILRLLEYEVVFAKLNTKHFGIPQSRPRVYLQAVCKECLAQPLVMPEGRGSHPDLHTFLDKETVGTETLDLPKYEEQLGSKLWTHGYVLDVAASPRYQHALTNCSPCLTKTRCQQHGFYIPKLRRRLSVQEMARLQGLPSVVTSGLLDACDGSSSRCVEKAVGDGMSINVSCRLFSDVCWTLPVWQRWAQAQTFGSAARPRVVAT